MAMRFFVLRANSAIPFGRFKFLYPQPPGLILFEPVWGITRAEQALAAVSGERTSPSWDVGLAPNDVPVLRRSSKQPEKERELVLVQEYTPRTGAKRWPAFRVDYGPNVVFLSRAESAGGSGWERWSLVVAPAGWAEDVARRFSNKRGAPDQTVRSELS